MTWNGLLKIHYQNLQLKWCESILNFFVIASSWDNDTFPIFTGKSGINLAICYSSAACSGCGGLLEYFSSKVFCVSLRFRLYICVNNLSICLSGLLFRNSKFHIRFNILIYIINNSKEVLHDWMKGFFFNWSNETLL